MSHAPSTCELSVFVVEDSELLRNRLVTILNNMDRVRVVGAAATADEASASINRLSPDVVTLDLQLGRSTGWDVLGKITCKPAVMVLSNFTGKWFRDKADQYLVAGYFDKTREFESFLDSIRELRPSPDSVA